MQKDYVFVYGTLRGACITGAHSTYLEDAEFIDDAKIMGKLYRVSHYPALVLDNSAGWVLGEVYRLKSAEQLIRLDAYEECTYPSLPDQEYQRKKVDITINSGAVLSVWIYTYQRSVGDLELIASGDFLNP